MSASGAAPQRAGLNRLALLLAASQPTYPFYVRALAGGDWWLAWFTSACAVPFALVPWAARRWPRRGWLLLPATGVANTALAVALFGQRSGVAALLVPCALIVALGAPGCRAWGQAGAVLALGGAVCWLMPGPVGHFTPAGLAGLVRLNLVSALAACVMVAMVLRRRG